MSKNVRDPGIGNVLKCSEIFSLRNPLPFSIMNHHFSTTVHWQIQGGGHCDGGRGSTRVRMDSKFGSLSFILMQFSGKKLFK